MSIAAEKRGRSLPALHRNNARVTVEGEGESQRLSSRTLTIALLILALGMFLRGWQFFLPRSLWMDEAFLALNIVERDFGDLAKPLDFKQGAPLGYLWGAKAATVAFGESARAIRLMSWLMSLVGLTFFLPVARRFVSDSAALLAFGLFAILPPSIYYAAELKPYSTDVAMSLVVLLMANRVRDEPARWQNWIVLGFVGAVATWFSFPVIFVLAAAGIVLGLQPVFHGTWRDRWPVLAMCGLWLLSFAVHFQLSMRHLASHSDLREWWHDYYRAYLPLPPNQIEDFKWFLDKGLGIFVDPVGLSTTGIALVCFLAGVQSLTKRSRTKLALLVVPILLVLLASAFRKYPFANRMIMFLTPMLLILVAEGAHYLRETMRSLRVVWITVLLLLFVHPVFALVDQVKRGEAYFNPIIPATSEEIEPLMSHLNDQWQQSDEVLVYRESQFAYRYYARQSGMQDRPFQVLNSYEPWNEEQRSQFEELRGRPRVWIVFSRIVGGNGHEHEPLLMVFDRMGKKTEEVYGGRGPAFLVRYDLSVEGQASTIVPSGSNY